MENKRYSQPAPSRGGARPGAGRPKGSGHKVKLEDLLQDVEAATNMPYSERLALNYALAIDRSDWSRVENYDKAFLNKLIADKQQVEIIDPEDQVARKRQAFLEALDGLKQLGEEQGKNK